MVKIERHGNGYKVKFSEPGTGWRGFSTIAQDLDEVKVSLDHYVGGSPKSVSHALDSVESCPLCRDHRCKAKKKK